ncbi:MAG: type II toxin-antitoxin system VapC family toxin [Candidatus Omnitrophica bacterium]|nr:type II toxin-antitoxin system VapC family toxin [Candidatus Omnitrophota bacterium]
MRAFVDTSSLFKRYVEERGSTEFDRLLQDATEIAVSPITRIEMNAVIGRRLRERSLTPEQATRLRSETEKDFQSFHRVIWSETLEKEATKLVYQYPLSTLDAIQLASGILSEADLFVTSDHGLFKEARKEVRKTMFL